MAICAGGSLILSSSRRSLTKPACLPSFGIPTSMPAIFKTASISRISIRTNARLTTTRQYRLGGHFDAAPGVTFVAVWTGEQWARDDQFRAPLRSGRHVDANTGEAAAYLTRDRFNLVAGVSVFSGSDQLSPTLFGRAVPITTAPTNDHSLWLYGNLLPVPGLRLTLGGDFDRQRAIVRSKAEFDPKLGISWTALPNTTLRGAWFETLKRPLIAPRP